jgi:hypothetical protein
LPHLSEAELALAEAAATLKRIADKAAADHNVILEVYVAESCTLFPERW